MLTAVLQYYLEQHSPIDRTDEWIHGLDCKDVLESNSTFGVSMKHLREYLEYYERHAFLDPFARFVRATVASLMESSSVPLESTHKALLLAHDGAANLRHDKDLDGTALAKLMSLAEKASALHLKGILHGEVRVFHHSFVSTGIYLVIAGF